MTVDWETIGPAKHCGEFKFWPQAYELWYTRAFGDCSSVDFTASRYAWHPEQYELRRYCSRRQ